MRGGARCTGRPPRLRRDAPEPVRHLNDGVQGGEAGVAGFAGNELYAYRPSATCKTAGSFAHIATSPDAVIEVALSNDGNWVATAGFDTLDLLPRPDGAGGAPQRIQFDRPATIEVAFAANQLTALRPAPGNGFAMSSYQPGTLAEKSTLPLDEPPRGLRRVRFAASWMINQNVFDSDLNL